MTLPIARSLILALSLCAGNAAAAETPPQLQGWWTRTASFPKPGCTVLLGLTPKDSTKDVPFAYELRLGCGREQYVETGKAALGGSPQTLSFKKAESTCELYKDPFPDTEELLVRTLEGSLTLGPSFPNSLKTGDYAKASARGTQASAKGAGCWQEALKEKRWDTWRATHTFYKHIYF